MIGHYLLTLTAEQEDRVLTEKLFPGEIWRSDGRRCLIGTAHDAQEWVMRDRSKFCTYWPAQHWCVTQSVAMRFDSLYYRFGVDRVTAAIRNRILSNRARRTLTAGCPLVRHEPQGLTRINQ